MFEIKNYKPAVSSDEMLNKDRKKVEEDDVLRMMQKREDVVLKNIDEVVKYILGSYESGYKVKSILLTPRTNYYAIRESKLNYLTWAEFMDKAKSKELQGFTRQIAQKQSALYAAVADGFAKEWLASASHLVMALYLFWQVAFILTCCFQSF